MTFFPNISWHFPDALRLIRLAVDASADATGAARDSGPHIDPMEVRPPAFCGVAATAALALTALMYVAHAASNFPSLLPSRQVLARWCSSSATSSVSAAPPLLRASGLLRMFILMGTASRDPTNVFDDANRLAPRISLDKLSVDTIVHGRTAADSEQHDRLEDIDQTHQTFEEAWNNLAEEAQDMEMAGESDFAEAPRRPCFTRCHAPVLQIVTAVFHSLKESPKAEEAVSELPVKFMLPALKA